MCKRIKLFQLLVAAAIPVAAAAGAIAWITAALGGVVLVLEGLQQVGQYQANWIAYCSTCTQRHRGIRAGFVLPTLVRTTVAVDFGFLLADTPNGSTDPAFDCAFHGRASVNTTGGTTVTP